VTELLGEVKGKLGLRTAIDVGCGVGHFAALLTGLGLQVTAVDGRNENVQEAQRRYPRIRFEQCDAEDSALLNFGRFDLVFCFGLLYHLENPLRAIRHLYGMTEKLLLVEGVIFPGTEPVMALIDEERRDDQGLQHIAFYPTEGCLAKMMYRSGFCHVYGFRTQPPHEEYRPERSPRRVRTMLAASSVALASPMLNLLPEPASKIRPWDPHSGIETGALHKFNRFRKKSFGEKMKAMKNVISRPGGTER
jgi:SAM-dependent methyltransferase